MAVAKAASDRMLRNGYESQFVDSLTAQQALPEAARPAAPARGRLYIPVRRKFALAMAAGFAWMLFSLVAAQTWIEQLSQVTGPVAAWLAIVGIAILPGFMNAFLVASLLLDRRPPIREHAGGRLPGITVLVAAYNEQANIAATVESLARQDYPGPLQVIVINDGSTDGTAQVLAGIRHPWLQVVNLARNAGKSNALNVGLGLARHAITITVDGDSYLYRNALRNLAGSLR